LINGSADIARQILISIAGAVITVVGNRSWKNRHGPEFNGDTRRSPTSSIASEI